MARILVTSALPYINGVKHLGNLIGSQLPSDAYARAMRQRGHEVLLICATDEHGAPAELAAAKAGQPVAEFCAEMHQVQAKLARGFRLSFDHFGRSSGTLNHDLTQHLAARLADAGLIREVSETQVYSHADGRSGCAAWSITRSAAESEKASVMMFENYPPAVPAGQARLPFRHIKAPVP